MTPALAGAARYLFSVEIGDATDAGEVRAGVERTCEKIERHLGRVVGQEGMRALIDRARLVAARDDAELALAGGPPDTVDAAADLIAVLVGLIARYIGDSLALQLLEELWPGMQTANRETS